MKIIGLTGGIACGKSTAAAIMREAGVPIIDADAISRALTAKGGKALAAIREAFGDKVFLSEDTLDRKALADHIFGNEKARQQLNGILHPLIFSEIEASEKALEAAGEPIVIEDIPLLFETGADARVDLVICLSVSREEQILRLAQRNGLSRKEAEARIDSQMPLKEKERRSDIVLNTDIPLDKQQIRIRKLIDELRTGDLKKEQKC